MDRYVERRVRHPQARFHYVGHSNGTYLLAKALADYPACSFDSVVFAGSVVHTRYPWARFLGGRVKRVMNYVATGDWVVAAFPNGLEQIGVQDLGAAGHRGFAAATEPSGDAATRRSPDGALVELRYVRGAHGAAIAEDHWSQIARFVVLGEVAGIAGALASDHQEDWVSRLGRGAWLIWVAALVLAALLVVWLALTVATVGIVPYLPLLAAGLVWYFVTRV